MKKVIRIRDDYGVADEIDIKEDFNIRKGDQVYVNYRVLEVASVMHDIEEETVYYNCFISS